MNKLILLYIVIILLVYLNVREKFIFGSLIDRFRRTISNVESNPTVQSLVDAAYRNVGWLFQGPRKGMPPKVKAWLSKNGDSVITGISVHRKPVQAVLQTIINMVSLGEFERNKVKLGYDDVYHLYLIVNYRDSDGAIKSAKIEKNAVVEIKDITGEYRFMAKQGEHITVYPVPPNLTINDLLRRGEEQQSSSRKGTYLEGESFWLYNPNNNNCQVFVFNVLSGSKLMTRGIEHFVLQRSSELLQDQFGWTPKFTKFVTDIGGTADLFLHGA